MSKHKVRPLPVIRCHIERANGLTYIETVNMPSAVELLSVCLAAKALDTRLAAVLVEVHPKEPARDWWDSITLTFDEDVERPSGNQVVHISVPQVLVRIGWTISKTNARQESE